MGKRVVGRIYGLVIGVLILFISTSMLMPMLNKDGDNGNSTINREVLSTKRPTKDYGVFVGLEEKNIKKLYNYKTVIIDAEIFSKASISKIKKKGIKVYSYINIGSIENFRSYYKKYKKYTLGAYENWDEERWIDVSKKEWQEFVINKLAKNLYKKGIDGFFIDNLDVYYEYPRKSIYKGILNILGGMKKKYKLPMIVNGGDFFVSKYLKDKTTKKNLVYAVNQECVLTYIDFKKNSFKRNTIENRRYYEKYFKVCKSKGVKIYLTEYTKDEKLKKEINSYCKKNKIKYYIASRINLD